MDTAKGGTFKTRCMPTVQLDLNLTLMSEVHTCILRLVPSIFEKLACLYTTTREIAVHNTI